MSYFKLYFYQSILNDAVEIIFAPNYKYDILDIIVCSLLTKEKLLSAISGRPIIDAFSKVLSELPSTDALESCLIGSKIFLLEKKFLGDTLINQLL